MGGPTIFVFKNSFVRFARLSIHTKLVAASQDTSQLSPGLENIHDKCTTELKKYITIVALPIRGTKTTHSKDKGSKTKSHFYNDPLQWRKSHAEKFPNMEVLTRKFLAIQGSSSASE